MIKISVIIPVYNAEKTLNKCVDSVLGQNFSSFEILLINDGSTDKSKDICQTLKKADSRISFFDRENGGAAKARNFGIDNAKGEYFCFVDSDDYLSDGALEFMYSKAKECDADILMCGYIMENGNKSSYIKAENGIFCGEEINKVIPEIKSKNLIDSPCNKLYKASFVLNSGVKMPENETFEDTDFNLNLLKFSPKFVVSDKCFYHYVLHMGSTTRRYNKSKLEIIKKRARLLSECTKGVENYCSFYYIKSVFSAFIDMFLSLKRKEILSEISNEISNEEFIQKAKTAYFSGKVSKVIIYVANKQNRYLVYYFCKLSYLMKYKFQKLFLRVR